MAKFSAKSFLEEKQPKGPVPFGKQPEVAKACKAVIEILRSTPDYVPCSTAALHEEMVKKCGYQGSCSTFRRHLKQLDPEAYEAYWSNE